MARRRGTCAKPGALARQPKTGLEGLTVDTYGGYKLQFTSYVGNDASGYDTTFTVPRTAFEITT